MSDGFGEGFVGNAECIGRRVEASFGESEEHAGGTKELANVVVEFFTDLGEGLFLHFDLGSEELVAKLFAGGV